MNPGFYLLLSFVFIIPSMAQTTGAAISKSDTVMQNMSETEEMYIKQIDYYHVHVSKNGRKMKITGYDNKIGSDNLNYPLKVSQDKARVKKQGVKIRNVQYFSYNTSLFKDINSIKGSKKQVFSKTEVNEKTISAKYTLPDKIVQYVLNGSYYRSKNSKNKNTIHNAFIKN